MKFVVEGPAVVAIRNLQSELNLLSLQIAEFEVSGSAGSTSDYLELLNTQEELFCRLGSLIAFGGHFSGGHR